MGMGRRGRPRGLGRNRGVVKIIYVARRVLLLKSAAFVFVSSPVTD